MTNASSCLGDREQFPVRLETKTVTQYYEGVPSTAVVRATSSYHDRSASQNNHHKDERELEWECSRLYSIS